MPTVRLLHELDLADINDAIDLKLDKDNITKQGSGFDTPETLTVSYDPTTRKVTLGGTGQAYWLHTAVSTLKNGYVSDARTDANGSWFLSYDGSSIAWSETPWTFDQVQIAMGIKKANAEIWIRECHGLMDWHGHQDEHLARGTYKSAGGDFSNFTPNSNTATNRRPQISSTTLWDEDLPTTLSALTTNSYAWLFLSGLALTNITTANAEVLSVTGAIPNYNLNTAGTWTQEPFPVNAYGKIFVVAVPVTADATNQAKRYLLIQPQTVSTSLSTIQAVTSDMVNWGEFTGLLPEFNFIGEIIVRYTAANWVLTEVNKINGTRAGQSVTSGGYLSSVTTDTTLTGAGTPASPLGVAPNTYVDLSSTAQTKAGLLTLSAGSTLGSGVSAPDGEILATLNLSRPWVFEAFGPAGSSQALALRAINNTKLFYILSQDRTKGIITLSNGSDNAGTGAYFQATDLRSSESATLKHSGTTRIETTATGAKVTGNEVVDGLEITKDYNAGTTIIDSGYTAIKYDSIILESADSIEINGTLVLL